MSFIRRVSSFQYKKKKNEEVKDEEWIYKAANEEPKETEGPEEANEMIQDEIKPKKLAEMKRRKSFSLESLGLLEAINQNQQFLRRKEMFNKDDSNSENKGDIRHSVPCKEASDVNSNINNLSKNRSRLGDDEIRNRKASRNYPIKPQTSCVNLNKESRSPRKRPQLVRRKSVSLENVCDSSELERKSSRPRIKFDSHKQLDLLEEFLSNFVNDEEKTPTIEKTRNFPVDEVEIRKNSVAREGIVRSKTLHIDTLVPVKSGNEKLGWFDVAGPVKVEIAHDSCLAVKKNDRLKFENGELKRLMKTGKSSVIQTVIKKDIQFAEVHSLNKKEVQLVDTTGRTYKLIFDDAKAAKQFIDQFGLRSNSITEKSSIKFMLRRFLNKRSSREQLESKGIIKDEPIFGNTLENIYNVNHCVPEFVTRTIELIERPENIKNMGLYRTSGNLATIQKIRLQVDLGKLDILNEYDKDVDVLSGSLKLFFRELKKPLLPPEVSEEIHKLKNQEKHSTHSEKIAKIIHRLPQANKETLFYLLRHLLKVVKYKEENKMDIHNISVCWSPSIFAVPEDCQNILTFATTAAKSLEFLLEYYNKNYKELEAETGKDGSESPTRKMQRQESKDSLVSNDSSQGKNPKRAPSDSYVSEVSKVIESVVKLIERNIGTPGLYKVPGSSVKVDKCHKKMIKRKLSDLDKYVKDVHDLAGALKKYIREIQEPLIPKETFEEFCRICDITENTRQQKEMILSKLESIPQINTLKFLLEHLHKVVENENNNVSAADIMEVWTSILTYNHKEAISNPNYKKLITILFEIYVLPHFEVKLKRENYYAMPDVIKEVQLRQQRASSYDNVPEIPELRKD